MKTNATAQQGFTLIQISILLTVAALVMVAVLPSSQNNATNNAITRSRMNAIMLALRQYQAGQGALPCPADASLAINSANYGKAATGVGSSNNCNAASGGDPSANYLDSTNHIAIGMVPVRSIGLPNAYAVDGYGRHFTYAVDTSATVCWATATMTGNILVEDNGAINRSVVALVSHGPDGHGAWIPLPSSSGTAVRLNAGSTDVDQHVANAHGISGGTWASNYSTINTLVTDSAGNSVTFVKKSPTSTFDDLVVYQLPQWQFLSAPQGTFQAAGAGVLTVPPAYQYLAGQTMSFTVTFPTAVTVEGTPKLDLSPLSSGSIGNASYTSGSGTNTLTFTYTVQSSDAFFGLTETEPLDVSASGASISPPYYCFTPQSDNATTFIPWVNWFSAR